MPKKIDPKVKQRCVQQMLEHVLEYPNPTAAAEVIAKRNGVGTESVRRWYLQAQVDRVERRGATTEELAEIRELKAKVRRLEEDLDIATRASIFFAGPLDPRKPGSWRLSMSADRPVMRASRSAESSASRAVRSPHGPTVCGSAPVSMSRRGSSATLIVMDAVRDLVWTADAEGELAGVRRLTPEGLYGRRKMTKLVQRSLPDASPGSVDRAMKALGLKGSGGLRGSEPRSR